LLKSATQAEAHLLAPIKAMEINQVSDSATGAVLTREMSRLIYDMQ